MNTRPVRTTWRALLVSYDGRSFRVERKDHSSGLLTETRHLYYTSAWQVLEERVDSSANPNRQFVLGLRYIDGLVLCDRDTSGKGLLDERLHALQDGNWNVTSVCDEDGDVQERYAYAAYGEPLFLSPGFVEQSGSGFGWEVLFTGQRWDGGSGLYLFRMRVYCGGVGVFVQRDPAGYVDGANPYLLDGRLSEVDPFGLKQFQMKHHHWFARLNGQGQKTVDRSCLPVGIVPSVKIDPFTIPMLGPSTTKRTVHYVIAHVQKYSLQYKTVIGITKPCDGCSFLKGVPGLMVANWVAANTFNLQIT